MHLYCYASSTFGRIVGKVMRIPTIVHDFDTQVYFPYPLYLRIADRLLARSTAKAFAASAHCASYMRDLRALPADRIEVLFHAIPTDHFNARSQLDRATARRSLGLGDEFLFAAVTKLGPDRGNEALLTAFADVRRRIPGAKLAIVYKPTLYHRVPKEYERFDWARDPQQMVDRVSALIDRLGVSDSVELVNSLEHPGAYYAAADVLIAPFENERFSSVNLVEGMAYGRAHIVTDVGEPADLVDRYNSGIKVPVGDAAKPGRRNGESRDRAAAAQTAIRQRTQGRGRPHRGRRGSAYVSRLRYRCPRLTKNRCQAPRLSRSRNS